MQPAHVTCPRFQNQPQFRQTESNSVGRLDTGPVYFAVTGFQSRGDIHGHNGFAAAIKHFDNPADLFRHFPPQPYAVNGIYNEVRVQ
ncbi:MAG: hypothetical protein BWY80_01320 [Firmicutes bacterium ADurb.Bin456]|nr:MAG: hypothetical protein BWY80_01320 [Firmicutes bacterium ADurb.Bin456]